MLSPSILSQVAAYTSLHDVWIALQNIFNAKLRSRKLQLWHELSTFKKGGLTTNQYLVAISKKADEVREDKELVLFELDGLDSSYDAFVIKISVTLGDILFSEFKGLLKAHEARTLREASSMYITFSLRCPIYDSV